MIAHPRIRCLSIGEPTSIELVQCATYLRQHTQLFSVPGIDAACDWLAAEAERVDWIVLWQPHPGRWHQWDVDRLMAASPLARVIQIAGVATEGEAASGQMLDGAARVYWHEFASRAAQVVRAYRQGTCGEWSLPHTATRADHAMWVAECEAQYLHPWRGSTVNVLAETQVDFEAVAQYCRSVGATAQRIEKCDDANVEREDILVWNLGDSRQFQRDTTLIPRIEPARGYVLIDFPRPAESRAWSAHGWRVIARPFRWHDVVH